MKVLLVLSAVLAIAVARPGYLGGAAGYYGAPGLAYGAYGGYGGYAVYGPANVAVGADGFLLDTPEVAAARNAHFAAVAQTKARDAAVNAADYARGAYGAYGLGYDPHGLGYGYGYRR